VGFLTHSVHASKSTFTYRTLQLALRCLGYNNIM